jgi:hypothetical protein
MVRVCVRDGAVVIQVDPRTGSVAVLNRDEMSVSVFSAARRDDS